MDDPVDEYVPPDIQFNYGYEDDEKKRQKIEAAIGLLSPMYQDIFNTFKMSPAEPLTVNLLPNTDERFQDSVRNPNRWMQAFTRNDELPEMKDGRRARNIYLNDSFFNWGDDDRVSTLGHELMHVVGMLHDMHPRAKKGMRDEDLSKLFTDDMNALIKKRKKRQKGNK